METYIVRIYRQKQNRPHLLVGTVEEVGAQGKKAFNNLDEFWTILNPRKEKEEESRTTKEKKK